MATYVLSSTNSDLTGGADYNKELVTSGAGTAGVTFSVAAGTTEVSRAFTPSGVPGASGVSGTYTVEVNITTGTSQLNLAVQVHRVNSSGVVQASSAIATEVSAVAGSYSFSVDGSGLGTWASGDRLRVDHRWRNQHSMNTQSATIATGNTASEVIEPAVNASVSTLTDDFDDGTVDTGKWTILNNTAGRTVTESGGALRLSWNDGTLSTDAASTLLVRATDVYDLTGERVYVKMTPRPGGGGISNSFGLRSSANPTIEAYEFMFEYGGLRLRERFDGGFIDRTSTATYSATDHAWLSFRESGGSFIAETAPDNNGSPGAWTQFHSQSPPTWSLASIHPFFGLLVWANDAITETTPALFDGLNTTAGAGANPEVALTGQSVTATQGSLSSSRTLALTDQSVSVASGTIVAGAAGDLTGQSVSVSQGSLASSRTVALSGQSTSVASGTIVAGVARALTGHSASVAAGAIGAAIARTLTGQSASASRGLLATSRTLALTGLSTSVASGTIVAGAAGNLTGHATSASAGALSSSRTLTLTGRSVSVAAGTIVAGAAGNLTGQSAGASAGALSSVRTLALTGQSASVSHGALSVSSSATPAFSTLSDPFDTLDTATKWVAPQNTSGGDTYSENGRLVQFVATPGQSPVAGQGTSLRTQGTFALDSDGVYIRLLQPALADSWGMNTILWVEDTTNTGDRALFFVSSAPAPNTEIYAQTFNEGGAEHSVLRLFDATRDAWLRIRQSGGTIYWDTAPSTASNPPTSGEWVNWTSTATPPSTFQSARLRLECSLSNVNAGALSQNALWDGLNTGVNAEVVLTGHAVSATQGAVAGNDLFYAPVPVGWDLLYSRAYYKLNAVSLSSATRDSEILTDTGEYKMGTARYRNGGQSDGQWSEMLDGFAYDVFPDTLSATVLPADYLKNRPLGEIEPIPGVGIRIYSRSAPWSAFQTQAANQTAKDGYTRANALGQPVGASGYLSTYQKINAAPPFARLTYYIPRFTFLSDNHWTAAMWSVEDGNKAWPNDTLHKYFEYDDSEGLGHPFAGTQEGQSVTVHLQQDVGGNLDWTDGVYEPEAQSPPLANFVGKKVGCLTVFEADRVKTYYNHDNGPWTQVSEILVSEMGTAEYNQRMNAFIHDSSYGIPWDNAYPSQDLHFDLVSTAIWAPSSNAAISVPSVTPPSEVTLTWRGSYGTSISDNASVGTTVADLSFPTGVTSASVITYNGNLTVVGTEVRVAKALDGLTQPTLRFHVQGHKADGAKSVGRLYETSVSNGPLSGLSATAAQGSLGSSRTVALSGQSATTARGSLTASVGADVSVALTGQSATAARGSLTANTGADVSTELSGLEIYTSAGTVIGSGVSETPTVLGGDGSFGLAAFGTTPFGGDEQRQLVRLTGHSMTVAQGAFEGMPRTVALTGRSMATAAGTLAGFQGTVTVTVLSAGTASVMSIGALGVRFYTTSDIVNPVPVPIDITAVDVPIEGVLTAQVPVDNSTVKVPVNGKSVTV